MRAGLIPSRALQERRILEERKILMAAKAREFEGRKEQKHIFLELFPYPAHINLELQPGLRISCEIEFPPLPGKPSSVCLATEFA